MQSEPKAGNLNFTKEAKLQRNAIFMKNEYKLDSSFLGSVVPVHLMNWTWNSTHENCKLKKKKTVPEVGKNYA